MIWTIQERVGLTVRRHQYDTDPSPPPATLATFLGDWQRPINEKLSQKPTRMARLRLLVERLLCPCRVPLVDDPICGCNAFDPHLLFQYLDIQSLLALGCVSTRLAKAVKSGGQYRVSRLLEKYQ